jgi:hypothetical protein
MARLPRLTIALCILAAIALGSVAADRIRSRAEATSGDDARIEQLAALGYVSGTREAPARDGVTRHHEAGAFDGLNLITSAHAPEAVITDMEGRVLHRWACDYGSVWPDSGVDRELHAARMWRKVHLLPNGDLLAIFSALGLIKLSRDSELIWAQPMAVHHDLDVAPNGDIHVLTRASVVVPRLHPTAAVIDDFITVLDPSGAQRGRVSVLEALEASDFASLWFESPAHRWARDGRGAGSDDPYARELFHTNSVEVLDGRLAHRLPAFRAGNVLVSLLNLDAIAVVDLERRAVVWARSLGFARQHDPSITESGSLLLFDNRGAKGRSRIWEWDPLAEALIWRYEGGERNPFYSECCGTVQRLPNGNTLVTETDAGRAFELDANERVVWEYRNPEKALDDETLVARIFEVRRLPPDFGKGWLEAGAGRLPPRGAARAARRAAAPQRPASGRRHEPQSGSTAGGKSSSKPGGGSRSGDQRKRCGAPVSPPAAGHTSATGSPARRARSTSSA